MKRETPAPEDSYPPAAFSRNGAGHDHAVPSAAAQPHEIPAPPPLQNGSQPRYLDYEEEEGIDPRQILGLLMRRWKIILATFLTVLLIGVLYTLLAQPVYEAKAKLHVSTSGASAAGSGELAFLRDLTGGQARKIETEIEILKSKPIQDGAASRLPAETQARLDRFSQVGITPLRNADIVEVAGRSRDPEAALRLANAICNEYIEQSLEQSRSQVQSAATYVEDQLQEARKTLDVARTALRNYKEANSVVELSAQAEARIAELGNIQAELRQAQTERQAATAQVDELRSMASRMSPTQEVARTTTTTPEVQAIQNKLTQLELALATARQDFTPSSPEVQGLESEIAAVKRQLSGVAKTEVSSVTENPNPIRQSVLQNLAQTQAQVWALDARAQALGAAQQRAQAALENLPEQEYNLSRLAADVAATEQAERMLAVKSQELNIQKQANVPTAWVVEQATETKMISPRRVRNFVMSALLGLMLAIALAALVDRMDDRIHSDEDAERFSRLPILTHIPLTSKEDQELLINQTDLASPLLESFRMLRANMVFSSLDKPLRSLCVTSSQPGEGKSTTAINLATVLAMGDKTVILVDADLRRPVLHRRLDLSNQVGLSTLVTGQQTLEDVLQSTQVPGLRVITSGPTPPNPFELLDSQAARNCFRQLTEQADFIVVDTPPALAVADTQIIATSLDGVLLVISAKEAGKREVGRMREVMAQTGAKLLGSVLNKVPVSGLHGYYGGYGYSYHPEYQIDNRANGDRDTNSNDHADDSLAKKSRETSSTSKI